LMLKCDITSPTPFVTYWKTWNQLHSWASYMSQFFPPPASAQSVVACRKKNRADDLDTYRFLSFFFHILKQ
jgi:hypothetical protein